MSGILNALSDFGDGIASAVAGGTSVLNKSLQNQNVQSFQQNGFVVPPIPTGDGNGLPSSKVPSLQQAVATRNIAHWFVPDVGIINMYINPQNITYNEKKAISKERTKGGYIVQYWGEELTTLGIRGHTGSSGIEGLNVLEEVYRSEQIMFDPLALTMAADNSVLGLNDLIDSALGNMGGFAAALTSSTAGILGLDPASQNILPRNPPSLAAQALGIEFYYNGWVFRGYFESFQFTESVERLGIFDYDINFVVTQRRGYRTNYMAWQRSATSGPSNADTVPLSFSTLAGSTNANPSNSTVAASTRGPFAI